MHGIIYCRVSSLEQVNGTSLEHQREACLAYAQTKGIHVERVFVEKGESATAADRTELINALDYCRRHKHHIGAFIVWKIDRFARNLTDHYGLQAQLLKYGTALHSVTESIIAEGPIGKMVEAMLAGYAQFENDIRKQRCEAGMQRKIAQGIWPWHPPLGYLHAKKLTDRRKTRPDDPDPERFSLIQRGLLEYSRGLHTIASLTEALNRWGLRTRTGKPVFRQLVDRMLRERYYAGVLVDPWTGAEHPGLHPAMLSRDDYARIQAVKAGLSNHATGPRRRLHPDFPLRQFARCLCSTGLTGSWHQGRHQRYAYYHCPNLVCDRVNRHVRVTELEQKFVAFLRSLVPPPELVNVFEKVVRRTWDRRRGDQERRTQRQRTEASALHAKKQRLLDMRVNGEIDATQFAKLRDQLEGQLAVLTADKGHPAEDCVDIPAMLQATCAFLTELPATWQRLFDPEHKQRFQRLVLPDGLPYDVQTGRFGTARLSPLFSLFQGSQAEPAHLVAGAGVEPAIWWL